MNVTHGPIAGRMRRPTWKDPRLLIGIALIALAVIGVSSVVRSADTTSPYYVARDTIAPGTVVTESHVVVAHVRVSSGTYAAPGQWEPGQVATRVIGQGELVPLGALSPADGFTGRPVAVRTALPLAATVERGSVVDVWLTVRDDDGPRSSLVASGLVVAEVDRTSGAFSVGHSETVYVVVPTHQMASFLDTLATPGDISVVGLAGGAS